jgi:hypothetical protein
MYGYVCDALSKGHSMCARARRNHHIIHPIPVATSTRLFFFFFLTQFCHIIVVASRPNACTIFFFHTYIHTLIHQMRTSRLFEQNKNLSLFFSFAHIYTDDVEKIAAGRKRRTRLSILRNDDVWARVYTQARAFCFYY